ncbi:hypothetical protein BDM02DRAFT_3128672 [Thelephora ganbajun]|uniref:Uncharacterized protein n=1 Tax=Thelephora ganbajun TaxID=370292 RepID=A0ACB6ZHG7_THEGA|nr:hypothetical protein BDM02DRAFT_3128672 [Thelephora ganbajun]
MHQAVPGDECMWWGGTSWYKPYAIVVALAIHTLGVQRNNNRTNHVWLIRKGEEVSNQRTQSAVIVSGLRSCRGKGCEHRDVKGRERQGDVSAHELPTICRSKVDIRGGNATRQSDGTPPRQMRGFWDQWAHAIKGPPSQEN